MAASTLGIPISILSGSLILATGLYLGLQRAPAPTPDAPPPMAPTVPPPAAPPATIPAKPKPPPLTPELRARATENARQALEAKRPELIERCWAPAVARQPNPDRLPLTYNMSFTPQGQLVVLGISDDPKIYRVDVATCLRSVALTLKIPAPGHSLQLAVPFTLP